MTSEEWKLVDPFKETRLLSYPCGASAGDRVRLRQQLVIHNHAGQPTGKINEVGEVWNVLSGMTNEPDIVWLREPNGDEHTWDNASLWDWFERI